MELEIIWALLFACMFAGGVMDGGSGVGLPVLPLLPPRTPPHPKTTRAVPSTPTLSPAALPFAAQCIAGIFFSKEKGPAGL